MLAVLTEPQWVRLMTTIGRPDALADPRFKDWAARTANLPALREILEEALASDDARTWEERLTKADVPCSSIWRIDEIVTHPQLRHRDVLQTVDSPLGASVVSVPSGPRWNAVAVAAGGGQDSNAASHIGPSEPGELASRSP